MVIMERHLLGYRAEWFHSKFEQGGFYEKIICFHCRTGNAVIICFHTEIGC
jgi:hypothetical protein